MSEMSSKTLIYKDKIDFYLNEVAKELKKLDGKKASAEIIIIGGASILINYGFRISSEDIDGIIDCCSSSIKQAINNVGDKYNLPTGWLNDDFKKTDSYSNKLIYRSVYYKIFNQVLSVRTVKDEYLMAMKLRASREYKRDLSDLVGIVIKNKEITFDKVKNAFIELYGDWSLLENETVLFLTNIFNCDNLEALYQETINTEQSNYNVLLDLKKNHEEQFKGKTLKQILKEQKK